MNVIHVRIKKMKRIKLYWILAMILMIIMYVIYDSSTACMTGLGWILLDKCINDKPKTEDEEI